VDGLEGMSASDRWRRIKEGLTGWLSILFDSSLLAIPVFLGVSLTVTRTLFAGFAWAGLALFFANGVPLTYLTLGQRFGWVSGYDLPKREERAPFIAVNLVGNGVGYLILRNLGAPREVTALLLVYVALAVVMMSISNYWKISLHVGGVGGFAAALTWFFGAAWLWAILAVPLIAWARVERGHHTWAQAAAGGVVGSLVTLIVLALVLGS
jgi:hypothetical protein